MSKTGTILVVDDEQSQRDAIAGFIRKLGYNVITCADGAEAYALIEKELVDLVVSDMRMPGLDGLGLLKKARALAPDITFILMTAFGSVDSAVESMRQGAFNYLIKPINLDELEIGITKALENQRLVIENRKLKSVVEARGEPGGIISKSRQMEEALNLVARVAPSMASVLIEGESGTGKERIARAIHYGSGRAEKPMITINCAAVPETLLESELFGHEKGAFTGAHISRSGKLEVADGGTLFIDEIGDLSPALQPKLLRFLQEGTIERLGSNTSVQLDIRVIAATHRPLRKMVAEGKFREDLFYRLNVINIGIPPLRERKEDIIPLAEHFIKIYSEKNSKSVFGLTREARDILVKYDYPGNVRELENAVEAAVVLTRSEAIDADDLPHGFKSGYGAASKAGGNSLTEQLEAMEKKLIFDSLKRTGGNKSEAARQLGISEKNIRDRLKRWGYKT